MRSPPSAPRVRLLEDPAEVEREARRLARAPAVAVDVESDGLFAYRAGVCVVQLATVEETILVDTLRAGVTPLAPLLGPEGTVKIVHDVSFDARVLAERGVVLANVRDTSVAARMLGRTSTGLASLLSSELGIPLDKAMQHHDWRIRPLDQKALGYLAGDVEHLLDLADLLFDEVAEAGIADEVDEETRYRLAQAAASVDELTDEPAYLRLKHIDRLPPATLAVLKHVTQVREKHARALDVPPFKVMGPDVLLAIAEARPTTTEELSRIRGAMSGGRARGMAREVLAAVARGVEEGTVPEAELARISPPRPPTSVTRVRRAREQRLTAWRKAEARARGIDDQVVLPGHCLKELAELEEPSLEAVRAVGGIGTFRVDRHGATWVALLTERA